MEKKQLRKKYLSIRNNLENDYIEQSSRLIFENLERQNFFVNAKTIFVFVNFGSEVKTKDFITKYSKTKNIYIPKIVKGEMKLVKFSSWNNMTKNNYGILEPTEDDYYEGYIDLVITPSIVFAEDGYRLGYGGGYYDRFFAKGKYKIAVGISFEKMIVTNVPKENYDKKVDYVISETTIRKLVDKIVVTTSVKTNEQLNIRAKNIADKLGFDYVKRNKLTIQSILNVTMGALVIYKDKISYYSVIDGKVEELFFHLDTAFLRIVNDDNAPLIDLVAGSKSVLDTTMGLARDSVVLSYYNYKVTALEKNKIIYYIVSEGLKNYNPENDKIKKAMEQIKTLNVDSYDYLMNCSDNSYDVVYFDPMFKESINESDNLNVIGSLVHYEEITEDFIKQAHRVAKKRIIIKAHFRDNIFEKYGFTRVVRKNTKFHYGYIDVE